MKQIASAREISFMLYNLWFKLYILKTKIKKSVAWSPSELLREISESLGYKVNYERKDQGMFIEISK